MKQKNRFISFFTRLTKQRLILSLLWFVLILLSGAASPQASDLISEFQKLVNETGKYRSFPLGKNGTPRDVYSCYEDKDGYWWVKDGYSQISIHRFNGTGFQDMFENFPKTEKDSLLAIRMTLDKSIIVYGKHHLYRWDGYRMQSYPFAAEDVIVNYFVQGNTAICLGKKGYAVLEDDRWQYYNAPKLDPLSTSFETTIRNLIKKPNDEASLRFEISYVYAVDKLQRLWKMNLPRAYRKNDVEKKQIPHLRDQALYLYLFEKGKMDSILVFTKEEVNQLYQENIVLNPILEFTIEAGIYLTFKNTNLLFWIDTSARKAKKMHYSAESRIYAISTFNDKSSWLVYSTKNKFCADQISTHGMIKKAETDFDRSDMPSATEIKFLLPYDLHEIILSDHVGYHLPDKMLLFRMNPAENTLEEIHYPRYQSKYDFEEKRFSISTSNSIELVFSIPHPTLPNCHRIYVYDPFSQEEQYCDLVDPTGFLWVLYYNKESNSIFLRGDKSFWHIPLNKVTEKIYDYGATSLRVTSGRVKVQDKSIITSTQYYGLFAYDSKTTYYLHQQDGIRPLKTKAGELIKNIAFIDRHNSNVFLRKEDHPAGNFKYSYLNLDNSTEYPLDSFASNYSLYALESLLYIFDPYQACEIRNYQKGEKQAYIPRFKYNLRHYSSSFDSIRTALNISPQAFTSIVRLRPLKDEWFYKIPVKSTLDQTGNRLFDMDDIGVKRFDKHIKRLKLTLGTNNELSTPFILYNVENDKLEFKENWHDITRTNSKVYIHHFEKDKADRWQYRISEFSAGKIHKSELDFVMPINDEALPIVYSTDSSDEIFVFDTVNNILHYRWSKRWQSLQLPDLIRAVQNINFVKFIAENNKAWIGTNTDNLVEISLDSKIVSVYSIEDGLPEGLKTIYLQNGILYLAANDGIYKFIPHISKLKLRLANVLVNKSTYTPEKALKLRYYENDLRFKVDILNSVFPEKCFLEYRLKGLEDEFKRRPFTSEIEYPKLSPGKYRFEISAIASDGTYSEKQHIDIRISAPFYATWWAYIIYISFAAFLLRALFKARIRQLKARNLHLEEIISERTAELKESHKMIMESIEYALLIQKSILPQESQLTSTFQNHFVVWRPRFIVGGDFYWMHVSPQYILFAVIDCTGHGVPGALLSMTVNSLLNSIVRDLKEVQAKDILQTLHQELGSALHQESEHTQQDGVDISLLCFYPYQSKLHFAGAGLHLLCYDGITGETMHYRGFKHGVGGLKNHKELGFTQEEISYHPQSMFYLYTDGIIDQPRNDPSRKVRLGHPNWLSFVQSITALSLLEQKDKIEEKINELVGVYEQRDDITVIGLMPPREA